MPKFLKATIPKKKKKKNHIKDTYLKIIYKLIRM